MRTRIQLEGRGLHTGNRCRVELTAYDGPLSMRNNGTLADFRSGTVERTDHGVRLFYPTLNLRVELIEHLAAALAGLAIQEGLCIAVPDGEVPLLDGGARLLAEALLTLHLPASPPRLHVTRSARLDFGFASYRFEPAPAPQLVVTTDFPGIGIERAAWDGSREQFLRDIASARTFGFASQRVALERAGRARSVDPRAVMILDPNGRVMPPGRARTPDELARHKLLDLLGDCFLFGGPPAGLVAADRPGHTANHMAFRKALDSGIVVAAPPQERTASPPQPNADVPATEPVPPGESPLMPDC